MSDGSLPIDDVKKVAKLARLALPDDQLAKLTGQLESILHYIDKLKQIDTTGVEPMAHALEEEQRVVQRLRDDKITESDQHALHQSIAPAVGGDLYLVPKVID